MQEQDFKNYFLNDSDSSVAAYRQVVARVAQDIGSTIANAKQPYSGTSPADLQQQIAAFDLFPALGQPLSDVLDRTRALVLENNISVYHPRCVAHLHCPVFIASLAAEMLISAFNQSMDSWDQAPAASMIEQALGEALCKLYGLGPTSDATFTSGGTMSNFLGLLLARDHYSAKVCGWNVQQAGLPQQASRFRIICSEHAHFSVEQSASILGLGSQAVVKLHTGDFNEESAALAATIASLKAQDLLPIAYVSTAGTTDFGAIGNLAALADVAHAHGLWFHVDAAYGGALRFSQKHAHLLAGLEKADSVTLDFHKLFYQPISCSVLLVRDKKRFDYIGLNADYLNPESNQDLGLLDLVYKSIQTTRRFDALKPFIALQHVGVERFGQMIDHTIDLAQAVAQQLQADARFELATPPMLNAVVFRYVPAGDFSAEQVDAINSDIKTRLLLSGQAIVGQTKIHERAYLKFTLLNPMSTLDDITALVDDIRALGAELAQDVTNSVAQAPQVAEPALC